jgi:hypothetical protein
MSVLFIEGFDHQNSTADLATGDDWTAAQGLTLASSFARYNGKGCGITGFGVVNLQKIFPASMVQGLLGFALNETTQEGAHDFVVRFIDSASAIQFYLYFGWEFDGDIALIAGDNSTVLYQSAGGLIVENIWNYIELQWAIGAAATLTLRLNGGTIYTGANNTNHSGSGNWQELDFLNNFATPYLDDMYVLNPAASGANTFLGTSAGVAVETLFPTANQGSQNFTPSPNTNANWQNVSETAMDSDTTYNFSPTDGNKDLFDIGALSSNPINVWAVGLRSAARLDSGTPVSLENRVVSSGTESDGASIALTSSYAYQSDIYETDPHTSAQWTGAGVDAAQIGYIISAV